MNVPIGEKAYWCCTLNFNHPHRFDKFDAEQVTPSSSDHNIM